MLHMYYMLVEGKITPGKWRILRERGLLTEEEERELEPLKKKPSAVYVWACRLIHDLHRCDAAPDRRSGGGQAARPVWGGGPQACRDSLRHVAAAVLASHALSAALPLCTGAGKGSSRPCTRPGSRVS